MPTATTCPTCRAPIAVPAGFAGALACPRCRAPVRVAATVADAHTHAPAPTMHEDKTAVAPLESFAGPIIHSSAPSLAPSPSSSHHHADGSSVRAEVERARADPARVFGRFVLLEKVGEGGMGSVFRAWDDRLKRVVAVKTLLAGADSASTGGAGDESRPMQRVKRLQREAEAIARLRHPAIVAVHDVGEVGGKHYLAMDFIDGTTLERRLEAGKEGKLPWTRALEALRDVARAVQYAHEQGVIHRDLKPANIMLDASDRPYVMDFGVARLSGERTTLITREGAAMGTPAYMPPEQADGASSKIGPWSDVYSLGATLYHVLTGRPLPPSALARRAAGDIETICLKCLEKDPRKRYASAGALADDLERYVHGEPITARPLGPFARLARRAKRNKLAAFSLAASFIIVAALGTGAAFLMSAERARARAEKEKIVEQARADAAGARARFEKARAEKAPPGAQASRERNDALLGLGLKALQASGRLASLEPDDAGARKATFETACRLGEVALEAEQWSLARTAFEEALELRVDDALAGKSLDAVGVARTALQEKHRKEAQAAPEAARAGAESKESYDRDEAVNSLVRLSEAQTVELLARELDAAGETLRQAAREVYLSALEPLPDEALAGQARLSGLDLAVDRRASLAPGTKLDAASVALIARAEARLASRAASAGRDGYNVHAVIAAAQAEKLGPGRLEAATVAAEALGRIGIADKAAGALGRYVLAEEDEYRAIVPGLALCRLKGPEAERYLRAARDRFTVTGPFVAKLIRLLPRDGPQAEGPADEASTVEALLNRGMSRMQRADYEGAIADFTKALELDPKSATAWSDRGAARVLAKDNAGALGDCARAIELDPKLATAWSNRAYVRSREGDYDGAISDATRAIELDPKSSRTWYHRGCARRHKQDHAGANADLTRALELDPRHLDSWVERGLARLDQGDIEGALADENRAIELDPRSAEGGYLARGIASLRKGHIAGAIVDFGRQIELDPKQPAAWSRRGEARVHSRDFQGAVADYTRAIELGGKDDLSWKGRGYARYHAGDFEGAISDFTRAIELDPKNAASHTNRGAARQARGDHEGAIADYTRAIEIDPKDASAFENRGIARRDKGDKDGAFADFSKAIELDPRWAKALDDRGNLRAARGDLEGALADITRAIELNPQLADG
ncbi:tetratricopeptide repeat protein, partial [bacterium]|nr:tetratricopeptide repeat protein [bacterium]